MNPQEKVDLEELLSSIPAPEPPEDLARRIREQIPTVFPAAATAANRSGAFKQWQRVAAVVLVCAAAYAGYRLSRASSRPDEPIPVSRGPHTRSTPARSPLLSVEKPPVSTERKGLLKEPPGTHGYSITSKSKPPVGGAPAVISGRVTDEQGGALPGVTVTVSGNGVAETAVTDSTGRVQLHLPLGGAYRVESALSGFATQSQTVTIASGEKSTFSSKLPLAQVTAALTVSGAVPIIDSRALPSGRNAFDFRSPSPNSRVTAGYYTGSNTFLIDGVSTSGRTAAPSTGGTHEPNDQAYGHVFFRTYGVNPFIDAEDDHLSTFGLDVDTGSYTIARRYLSEGHLPPAEAIRVEEFVNAFDYGDPRPDKGDFAIRAEGAPTPFARGERYRIVRFHLQARSVEAKDRKPASLTFIVDVSGSMAQENRLELVKRALGLLLDQLRKSDRVGLVVFGTDARVVLEPTGDLDAIRYAIASLAPEGSTNTEAGLRVGYEMASRNRREGTLNRVILCSDGVANVGRTGPESILPIIEREAKSGIELTTVGFGMGNYNDVLMEQLADRGKGRYAYVDTLEEARRIFVENLTGTLQTIASDARAQVDFDPSVVARFRLLGYENREMPHEQFRNDRADAGQVGTGHGVTALYEIKLRDGVRSGTVATLRLRYRSTETGKVVELAAPLRVADLAESWEKAPRAVRLASLVAEFSEVLKHSYWAKEVDLSDLFRQAQKLSAEYPGNSSVAELASLVGRAAQLWPAPAKTPPPEE